MAVGEQPLVPQAFYKQVGRRISVVRDTQRGLTQQSLATLVSLSRTSIANIERGKQQILLHHFYAIAKALNVPPVELLPSDQDASAAELDELLANLPANERTWIQFTVAKHQSQKVKSR